MRLITPFLLALPLAGCNPQPLDSGAAEPAQAPTPRSVAPAVELIPLPGEYRVAGVDGREIDQPYAITASISAERIHVTADCLNFAWRYTRQDNRIATERVAVEGCGRGPTAAEVALVAALDGATEIARTPANAVELRGDRGVVTLFSQ